MQHKIDPVNTTAQVEIKIDEAFEHLPRAPIVEAVIDIQARATQNLEEPLLRSQLETRLESYRFLDSLREFHSEVKIEPGRPPSQVVRDLGWKGVRFRSSDEKHIAQFNRDGFAFSRFEPYVTWERFSEAALTFWSIYQEIAQPREIHRIGLRYINRIQLPLGEMLFEDYINAAPTPPTGLNLPFQKFMHHDTLTVPEQPYSINLIRTIQSPASAGATGFALILDIDVFTPQVFELDEVKLTHRLLEMRWLKNKAFFGSVTEKALERFR